MSDVTAKKDFNSAEVLAALRSVNVDAKTKVLSKVISKRERDDNGACGMAMEVLEEGLNEWKSGDLEWEDMLSEVNKTLKAIDPKNLKGLHVHDPEDDEDES